MTEADTGLHILPSVKKDAELHSSHILASVSFRELVEKLRTTYDYVVMDLPPVGPVAGVRAIGTFLDGYVIVVEWGRTAKALVRESVLIDSEIAVKCLGVVYNKVNMQKLKMYEGVGSPAHQKDFRSYYNV